MKKHCFSTLLFLLASISYGQISYKKGYFIDNENKVTECFIKNNDWLNNPDNFLFRETDSDISKEGSIESVKEFCIDGISKYIRADILIDRSNDNPGKLTSDKNPEWSEERLFLKVLVEGRTSLYYYRDGTVERFFYSISDTAIYQLVYKKYLIFNELYLLDESKYTENNKFRQQLWMDLRYPGLIMKSLENISYNQRDLTKYFVQYNSASGDTIIDHTDKSKRYVINLKITPGISNSSWAVRKSVHNTNSKLIFNNCRDYRLGLESELILPFNRNKWGVLFEPSFQYCKTKTEFSHDSCILRSSLVDFPIGLRYYAFFTNDLSIYLDGFYTSQISLNLDSEISYYGRYDFSTYSGSYTFGIGIRYKKISAEIRYLPNREFTSDYIYIQGERYWSINQRSVLITVGYKLFEKRF